MKITNAVLAGVAVAAALNFNQNIRASEFSLSDLNNRAIANSPRAREEFPWLTWAPEVQTARAAFTVPASVTDNSALVYSPRIRELYPTLAVGETQQTVETVKVELNPFAVAPEYRDYAASPRVREQYPALERGSDLQPASEQFQVAPVK